MRSAIVVLVVWLVLAAPSGVRAAEWGTIAAGTSTLAAVRAQYGEPSKVAKKKVENYDVTEWLYEGDKAPRGIRRLGIEFGLLTPAGFRPDVVRLFSLEPSPGVFLRSTIVAGWGEPEQAGRDGDTPVFIYESGLIVQFDREGWIAERMIFTPRQPHRPPER